MPSARTWHSERPLPQHLSVGTAVTHSHHPHTRRAAPPHPHASPPPHCCRAAPPPRPACEAPRRRRAPSIAPALSLRGGGQPSPSATPDLQAGCRAACGPLRSLAPQARPRRRSFRARPTGRSFLPCGPRANVHAGAATPPDPLVPPVASLRCAAAAPPRRGVAGSPPPRQPCTFFSLLSVD